MSAPDPALVEVQASLAALEEIVAAVRTSVVEDRPDDADHAPDHKVLTDLVDAVDDLCDVVAQTGWQLRSAQRPAVRCLVEAHGGVLQAGRLLREDLLSIDRRFDAARREVRGWGAQWRPWTAVVHTGLVEAVEALTAAEKSVADAWLATAARHEHRSTATAQQEEARS
jgi:hypothetical protein